MISILQYLSSSLQQTSKYLNNQLHENVKKGTLKLWIQTRKTPTMYVLLLKNP